MPPVPRAGTALLELLLALGLTAAALAFLGPAAARSAHNLARGRALLEGTQLALQRREMWLLAGPGGCGLGSTGQDSGRLVTVDWATQVAPGGMAFVAVILDHGRRFPAETLATVLRCPP
ncbi:MAG: hypothetical protein SGI84_08910 [Gemmatimonadota bacterium]|nr:hypothetical protein [Gemmatimonadota bacterium]